MWPDYKDIIRRAGQPNWYDSGGIPRYGKFHPDKVEIYAQWVAFVEIACQSCDKRFHVAVSRDRMELGKLGPIYPRSCTIGSFHYGDPPRHGSLKECAAGDTMNSTPIRIIELWYKDEKSWNWKRNSDYEVEFMENYYGDES